MKSILMTFLLWLSPVVTAAQVQPLKPIFYAVAKDGRVGFILGTYHFLTVSELPPFILQVLDQSPVFINEWDGFAEPSQKLTPPSSPLSDETLQKLRERGLDLNLIERLPRSSLCMAYLFLESYQVLLHEGGSLDQKLAERALQENKTLIHLDQPQVSGQVQKNIEAVCHIDQMVQQVSPELARRLQNRTLYAYRSGDFRLIPNADQSGVAEVGERNQRWLIKIKELLPQGPFIAVGAGHLSGRQGLLNLLAAEGYSVRRINSFADLLGSSGP